MYDRNRWLNRSFHKPRRPKWGFEGWLTLAALLWALVVAPIIIGALLHGK